ncbi:F-box/WD repeat-containing protein 4-like [Oppia nitens]|uniref:F-box/WD repeat-containing protein 4-like n=1 Tax=Oppia nitens TaxID=1686743 RepID=UPI0023DAAF33|nr:F-box/WD repeat-containing protein 4-like [Oppia nitens]
MNDTLGDNCDHKSVTLETLPSDILYVIFSYCDIKCLLSLSCCSLKLYRLVITDPYVWLHKSLRSLVTNQLSPQIICRSSCVLSTLEKCRVSHNWINGVYKEKVIIRHKTRYLPWICLEKDFLWLTKGNIILRYKRKSNNYCVYKRFVQKLMSATQDICRFVVTNDLVISGGRRGCIAIWDKYSGKSIYYENNLHLNDINSVDSYKNRLIISGSKDKHIKLWSIIDNNFRSDVYLNYENTILVNDRIWTVATNELSDSFIVGSAGCGPMQPLIQYDIQSGQLLNQFGTTHQRGAGVLHAFWESNTQVLSCGYDSFVRLWDTRATNRCVNNFEDPHDSVVYCMSSDHLYTIMTGTARYGLTRLWDKRYPNKCIQMYYVGNNNSPVYSLSFDPLCAYVALESSINKLSFI